MNTCDKCGQPIDTTWQERVFQERQELSNSIVKLCDFINSGKVWGLPESQQKLLSRQYLCMQEYLSILDERLKGENK